jgi:hypothetical protein
MEKNRRLSAGVVVESMESRVLFSFVIHPADSHVTANAYGGGSVEQEVHTNPAHAEDSSSYAGGEVVPAYTESGVSNESYLATGEKLTLHGDATRTFVSSGSDSNAVTDADGDTDLSFTLTAAATVHIDGTLGTMGRGVAFVNFFGLSWSSRDTAAVHQAFQLAAGDYSIEVGTNAELGDVNASATVDVVLTLGATATKAPKITSANAVTFKRGLFGLFMVRTSGDPTPSIHETAILPGGIKFVDNGDGTGTIWGTPRTSDATGVYRLILSASNGTKPDANQFFGLTIAGGGQPTGTAAKISSGGKFTFKSGVAATFEVRTTGHPAAKLSVTGKLPTGVRFQDNGDGSGSFFGSAKGAVGMYEVVLHASNGVGKPVTQEISITVSGVAPIFAGAKSATLAEGKAGTFTIHTTAKPVAKLTETGKLPAGMRFVDKGDGTAIITGKPTASGSYKIIIHAANGVGAARTEEVTLIVPRKGK